MFLLDTHTLFWWVTADGKLSKTAYDLICEPENPIFVSPVSAYEIALKVALGKLKEAAEFNLRYHEIIGLSGFVELPLTGDHAHLAGNLPLAHRDPFDRLLAGQAIFEHYALITADQNLAKLGLNTIW